MRPNPAAMGTNSKSYLEDGERPYSNHDMPKYLAELKRDFAKFRLQHSGSIADFFVVQLWYVHHRKHSVCREARYVHLPADMRASWSCFEGMILAEWEDVLDNTEDLIISRMSPTPSTNSEASAIDAALILSQGIEMHQNAIVCTLCHVRRGVFRQSGILLITSWVEMMRCAWMIWIQNARILTTLFGTWKINCTCNEQKETSERARECLTVKLLISWHGYRQFTTLQVLTWSVAVWIACVFVVENGVEQFHQNRTAGVTVCHGSWKTDSGDGYACISYNPTGFDLVGWHVMQTIPEAKKKVELLWDGDCIGRCCESLNVCLCCGRLYQMGLLASCWFKYFDDE